MIDYPYELQEAELLEEYRGGLNAFVHISLPDEVLVDIEESKVICQDCTKLYYKNIERGIPKHGLLHKLFNKTNLRISYSCTENIGAFIARHNCKIMRDYEKTIVPKRECNCSPANRNNCPLNGQCLLQSLVYRADVTTDRPDEHRFYFGLVSNSFKERYGNHLKSFRHEKYKYIG